MNKYKDDILRYSFFLISIIIFIVCLIGGVYWNYAYKLDISKSNVYIFLIACLIFGVNRAPLFICRFFFFRFFFFWSNFKDNIYFE